MDLGSHRGNVWRIAPDVIDTARAPAAQLRVRIEARPKPVIVDLAASAILVIDMQERFCRPRPGETDTPPTAAPIEPLGRLLPHLRANGVAVVWVNWGTRPDKLNLAPGVMYPFTREGGFRPPLMDKGSADAAIVPELTPSGDDIHVDKHRLSGFWDTPLDSILRNLRVTTLFFAGVNLDQCVYATLLDAHCLGYDAVLVEDCAATRSPGFCAQATLWNVAHGLGFVTGSNALMTATPA